MGTTGTIYYTQVKTVLLSVCMIMIIQGGVVQAGITCYPSTPEFLNAPPATFPAAAKPVPIVSMEQLEKRYGMVFPDSEGFSAYIQTFEIHQRGIRENAITSSMSGAPRIIEFTKPVKVFGMFAENFGDVGPKADAQFEITFADGTTDTCFFPDPDPTRPEMDNPLENRWYRFFGVSSDVPITRIVFSNVSDERDGFRIWGFRIAR